eukprot:6184413-Pleurochrysis_carterae.AAC.6
MPLLILILTLTLTLTLSRIIEMEDAGQDPNARLMSLWKRSTSVYAQTLQCLRINAEKARDAKLTNVVDSANDTIRMARLILECKIRQFLSIR